MLIELLKLKPVKKNTTSLRKEEGIYEQLLHGAQLILPPFQFTSRFGFPKYIFFCYVSRHK
jgi:hypothetical protein